MERSRSIQRRHQEDQSPVATGSLSRDVAPIKHQQPVLTHVHLQPENKDCRYRATPAQCLHCHFRRPPYFVLGAWEQYWIVHQYSTSISTRILIEFQLGYTIWAAEQRTRHSSSRTLNDQQALRTRRVVLLETNQRGIYNHQGGMQPSLWNSSPWLCTILLQMAFSRPW